MKILLTILLSIIIILLGVLVYQNFLFLAFY
jgi:hypothetical protein